MLLVYPFIEDKQYHYGQLNKYQNCRTDEYFPGGFGTIMTMKSNKRYNINEMKVISELLDGETIIINLENGNYYSLNETGSLVWNALVTSHTLGEIVDYFCARFNATKDEIEAEISKFVSFLEREALVMELVTKQEEKKPLEVVSEKSEFVLPKIEKYEDMQEMLLADPIHDVTETGWPVLKKTE